MGQATSIIDENHLGQTSRRIEGGSLEPLALSVIIPALNESTNISAALNSARSGLVPPLEILVVDGGSNDDTVAQAQQLGAQVISAPRGRGRQLNAGWRAARGDWCLFLHSDSQLPPQYDRLIAEALRAAAIRQDRSRRRGWATSRTDGARRAAVAPGSNACRPPIDANGGGLCRAHPPLASGPAWAVGSGKSGRGGGEGCSTAGGMGGGCSACCGPAGRGGSASCGTCSCSHGVKRYATGRPEWPSARLWAAPGGCTAASAATADAAAAAWVATAGATAAPGPAGGGWNSCRHDRGREGDHTAAARSHLSQDPRDKDATVAGGGGADYCVRCAAASVSGAHENSGKGPMCGRPGRSAVALTGPTWGAFANIETDLQNPILRSLLSTGVELRTRWLHRPYGDQALFVRRDILEACGGFVEWPLLEDLEMVVRLGQAHSPAIVDAPIHTSARRWKAVGFLRTTLLNQVILVGYALGASPDTLARWYTSAKRAMA